MACCTISGSDLLLWPVYAEICFLVVNSSNSQSQPSMLSEVVCLFPHKKFFTGYLNSDIQYFVKKSLDFAGKTGMSQNSILYFIFEGELYAHAPTS